MSRKLLLGTFRKTDCQLAKKYQQLRFLPNITQWAENGENLK
jgi:hypothetical protein